MAKLKSNDKDDKALSRYTMHRVVNDIAIINVIAPNVGEFGLEIFCGDPQTDGSSLLNVYQYLIVCDDLGGASASVEPLPALAASYLGPQPTYQSTGLTVVSHVDPYIQTDTGDLDVVFSVPESNPLRISSQLIYVTNDESVDSPDYVLQLRGQDKKVYFKVRLSKPGMYKLQIFAISLEDTTGSLPGVYNFLINTSKASIVNSPYPKQYSVWKDGAFLHAPLDGILSRANVGSTLLHFKVDVPKTSSLSVVVGKDWTPLALRPSGSWEAEVNMDKYWSSADSSATILKLCAKYEEDNFSVLLEYTIQQ